MARTHRVESLRLPWPPTTNKIWPMDGGRPRLSHAAKSYRVAVFAAASRTNIFECDVRVSLVWYPPDRRRRDIDNPIKSVLDALQHAQVFTDDRQVRELHVSFTQDEPEPPGHVWCTIEELEP